MRNFRRTLAILASVVVVLKCVLRTEAAIRCYKCSVARYVHYINETIRLCEDFDHSDKYIVDCPYSTLCMKRIASAKISDTISGIERDCASQKSENQKLENRTWHLEVTIEEPYEEGCSELNDKGARSTKTEYCYCKGDLCNSSPRSDPSKFFIFSTVIVLVLRQALCRTVNV